MTGMMRYLVETDYLSGSWMRIEEEPFASVAAAAGALAHLRGEFPGGPRTRRRGSALPSQIHAHVPRAHLGLNVLAHPPKPSDVSCEHQSIPHYFTPCPTAIYIRVRNIVYIKVNTLKEHAILIYFARVIY